MYQVITAEMPVRTRSQTATNNYVEEAVKAPLTREEKKQLREEMKMKEREDRERESTEKFNSGVHKALRERTQFIIDNGYVDSPVFDFIRRTKKNSTEDDFKIFMLYVRNIPKVKECGEMNITSISQTFRISREKEEQICRQLLRKFMTLVTEIPYWKETNRGTRVGWSRAHNIILDHAYEIFETWTYYKNHFSQFPDCVEF